MKKRYDELVEKYEKMVWYIVHKYNKGNRFDSEELHQAGLYGLWRAQVNYKKESGTKFSSYAYINIEGWIRKEIQKNNTYNMTKSDLDKIIDYKTGETTQFSYKDTNLYQASIGVQYLDEPVGDGDFCLKETLVSDASVENAILQGEFVEDMLSLLDETERSVFVLRYIEGYKIKEVQDILGVSHTTVWNKSKASIKKIRENHIV